MLVSGLQYIQKNKIKAKFTPGNFGLRVSRTSTGLGLFAKEEILKGQCITEYIGRKVSEKEQYEDRGKYLFWAGKNLMINGNIKKNIARYINHSCAPNCEADGPEGHIFILSTKKIKAGEELTYDYGKEYFNKHIKPFGCRCKKCKIE